MITYKYYNKVIDDAKHGKEDWSPLTEFDPRYEVSSFGRVRSWKGRYAKKPHIMKSDRTGSGYRGYILKHGSRMKELSGHRLVANHFIPNPHHYPQVDHIDGNKENNSIFNLRFVTARQNNNFARHRYSLFNSTKSAPLTLKYKGCNYGFRSRSQAARWLKSNLPELHNKTAKAIGSTVAKVCKTWPHTKTLYNTKIIKCSPRTSVPHCGMKITLTKYFEKPRQAAEYLKSKLHLSAKASSIESGLYKASNGEHLYHHYAVRNLTTAETDKLMFKKCQKIINRKYGSYYTLLDRFKKDNRYFLKIHEENTQHGNPTFITDQNRALNPNTSTLNPNVKRSVIPTILTKNGHKHTFKVRNDAARYLKSKGDTRTLKTVSKKIGKAQKAGKTIDGYCVTYPIGK